MPDPSVSSSFEDGLVSVGVPIDNALDAVVDGLGYLVVDPRHVPEGDTYIVVVDEDGRVGTLDVADEADGTYTIRWGPERLVDGRPSRRSAKTQAASDVDSASSSRTEA